MADTTPQLKRKREGAEAQRKKARTQRKNDAAADKSEKAPEEPVATTPVAKPTSKPVQTPKSKDTPKATPPNSQANGVREDAPAATPSTARKDKKNKGQNGEVEGVKAPETPAAPPALSKSKRRQLARENLARQALDVAEGVVVDQPEQVDQDKAAKKKAKKDKTAQDSAESTEVVKVETPKANSAHVSKPKKQKSKTPTWSLSNPYGGWFLPTDPVFSSDEKYLILGDLRALHIYSTETSLLARTLPAGSSGVLTSYALSATKPNHVYVAGSTGLITLWDWVDGTKIGRWEIGATVRNMAVIAQPESTDDLVYCHETGNSHVLNVHALRTKAQASQTELKRILKTSSPILGFQVLLQGKIVIVATAESITVGKRLKVTRTAVQDFDYAWREFKLSKRVTAFSAYVHEQESSSKAKKQAQDQREVLDIAVGEDSGVILLFEDILASFAAIESNQKSNKGRIDNAESLRPKRFHWHRDAVGSVKWSLDGNYLISGGDETVLTIWQLATGKPQHLPHLTAAIENVVVSPTGSSYALSLANNSVIVLSTTELEARTNIVGIQSRRVELEQHPKENSSKASFSIFNEVPMAINPKNPREVLFSVPSSQPRQKNEGLRPEPYLQTFDVAHQRPLFRQALTRNNATDPNMGPEGRRIIEPSVKMLQVSHDGEWLASVDEWVPPRSDTGYLNEGIPEFNEDERLQRREVYLKLWQHDEQQGQWKLQARIDGPHFFEDVCGNGRAFDMVADPTSAGFATVGEDHVVRIWRPKTRLRDGIIVRGAAEKGLVTWSLDRSVQISDKLDIVESNAGSQLSLPLRTSRLAFSADSSVLAVALSWASESDPGVIHLIDTETSTIRRSITEIDVTALCSLGIVNHHLIVIGDTITVWDMVLDQLISCTPITTPGIDRFERIPLVRLATNPSNNTFAVSLPQFDKNESTTSKLKRTSSKILVFNPQHPEPLSVTKASGITLALTAQKTEPGYFVLDSAASLRALTPAPKQLPLLAPPQDEKTELERSQGAGAMDVDVDGDGDDSTPASLSLAHAILLPVSEHDKAVVRSEQLQQLFEESGPSHASLPAKGLFRALVGLRSVKVA